MSLNRAGKIIPSNHESVMANVTFSRSEEEASMVWSSQRSIVECMVTCWVLVVKREAGGIAVLTIAPCCTIICVSDCFSVSCPMLCH